MFTYAFYNVLHVIGIVLVMVALGGMSLHAAAGGTRAQNPMRVAIAVMHGLGVFIILLAGFGMLARIGIMHGAGFPGWVWGKLVIWLLLGAAAAVPYRWPGTARAMLLVVPLLAGFAAYLAIYKPI